MVNNENPTKFAEVEIIRFLNLYTGETGENESLVETLGRLLDELDEYRAGDRRRVPVCPNCDGNCTSCRDKETDNV